MGKRGWYPAGGPYYRMGIDAEDAAFIHSEGKEPVGFGTLMRSLQPDPYRGERLEMTASLRTRDVAHRAGLWLRVDGPARSGHEPLLRFDDMSGRPIRGTTEWARHRIVLDVPRNAAGIAYGILLHGPGDIRVSDFCFEVVGPNVPTTVPALVQDAG